jgi:C4-type Zn-finger protein
VKVDMSHQEMDRLVQELTTMWEQFTMDGNGQSTGVEWLPADGIAHALLKELGYEDMDEFEDALKGSFVDFLDLLPNVVKKTEDRGNGPRVFFQLKPDPPQDQWRSVKMTVHVGSPADLWRVCLKSPYARIEIPELEFEISQDGKRHIDSMYNHIAGAIFNLSLYVRQSGTGMPDDTKEKIMDTVLQLNEYLDVGKPWTWVLHDPSGLSEFKPSEGITIEWGPEPGTQQPAQEDEQQAQVDAQAADGSA